MLEVGAAAVYTAMKEVFVACATVLMHLQAVKWRDKGVAWVSGKQAIELARWYIVGLEVGKKPLADGLCSFCGNYVFGGLASTRATSNRRSGSPRNCAVASRSNRIWSAALRLSQSCE